MQRVYEMGICFFSLGVGALAAIGCQATWRQAIVFTSIDLAVGDFFINYFMSCTMSSRQRLMVSLTGRIISCLSGVLATRLRCKKTIEVHQAIIAQCASTYSFFFLTQFYMGESGAMPMKV